MASANSKSQLKDYKKYLLMSFCYVASKHLIKVSCSQPDISRHSHTLQACSDYNKKAWLDAFSLAKSQSVKQQHQIAPSPSMTSLLSACSTASV